MVRECVLECISLSSSHLHSPTNNHWKKKIYQKEEIPISTTRVVLLLVLWALQITLMSPTPPQPLLSLTILISIHPPITIQLILESSSFLTSGTLISRFIISHTYIPFSFTNSHTINCLFLVLLGRRRGGRLWKCLNLQEIKDGWEINKITQKTNKDPFKSSFLLPPPLLLRDRFYFLEFSHQTSHLSNMGIGFE